MDCGGYSSADCAGSCSCNSSNGDKEGQNSDPYAAAASASTSSKRKCYKCKELPAQVCANQREPLCVSCLNSSLYSKFKTAVNARDLILPTDKVLLAFSGGPASRVALEFLADLRKKAQQDASHCHDRSVMVFGFGVVYIDEKAVLPAALSHRQIVDEELAEVVMTRSSKPDEFLVVPLESVYSKSELKSTAGDDVGHDCSEALQLLVERVADRTGKEDLLEHLRMQVLQQVASANSYTKLVLGVSTSRIAAKVISATAKGCGFSLPADMQYYDARWNVPVVLPLRDCGMKELALLCHLRHLKTVSTPSLSTLSMPQNSINSLSASFVSMLQEENPSRERTIMQTAAKLQPFSFNNQACLPPKISSQTLQGSTGTLDSVTLGKVELLCPICFAPLPDEKRARRTTNPVESSCFSKRCCCSCKYQILGMGMHDKTEKLLPELMKHSGMANSKLKEMWLRSELKDFLLCDDECNE